MAGIDVLDAFPNSKMAKAVKLGQSRFITGEEYVETGTFSEQSATFGGIFTPTGGVSSGKNSLVTLNAAGSYATAQLLTAAGFTTEFSNIDLGVLQTSAGVNVAQGTGSITLKTGASAVLPGTISAAVNPVTITLAGGDVVILNCQGV